MAAFIISFRPNACFLLLATTLLACGCAEPGDYPNRPITLVCPWAAGGGTDRVSRQIAAHLESELAVPVNVINATGGKGVTGHARGLKSRPDGYTLQMATLELNMMHWSGLTGLTYEDCLPLMSVNEDYAALFVRQDAPWHSLAELQEAIKARPGQLKSSGTSSGGAWHLGLAGWLLAAGLNATDVVWISSTGSKPSLQELLSGGLDMVCCSLPEARELYDAGEVRALGVMAPRRAVGFEDVPTFPEQGVDWSLGGWRALAVPVGTPTEIVDVLVAALKKTVTGQTTVAGKTFPVFMQEARFDNTWRVGQELHSFLRTTDEKFGQLLTHQDMKSVNEDRFHPMAFPWLVLALLGISTVAVVVQHSQSATVLDESSPTGPKADAPGLTGLVRFAMTIVAGIAYILLAEQVGFLLTGAGVLFALLLLFSRHLVHSLLITLLVTPAVYQFFAHVMRVPLPRGWWGW